MTCIFTYSYILYSIFFSKKFKKTEKKTLPQEKLAKHSSHSSQSHNAPFYNTFSWCSHKIHMCHFDIHINYLYWPRSTHSVCSGDNLRLQGRIIYVLDKKEVGSERQI